MDLKEFYLKQKQAVHQGSLSVYGKIPPDRLDWRPVDSVLTLGQVVRHAWMSEQGIRRIALDNDWTYFEKRIPQGLPAVLGEVKSLADELQEIARVHTDTLRAVEAFPRERWHEIRENAQFEIKRSVSVWLYGINEHQIHHRAQVGVYLRILTGERASSYAL
jgi:uncharacterized damage-inducible protein DinB